MRTKLLRNKLMLGAVAISAILALAFMLAVSWVISQQHQQQSNSLLRKATMVIEDNLEDRQGDLLAASHQFAAQKNLGSTIWYLGQYAQTGIDRETLFNTYQQLLRDTVKITSTADLSKIAYYDASGHLVSFVLFDANSKQVGFLERFPAPVFKVATLKDGEELNRDNLRTAHSISRIDAEFSGRLPHQENLHYVVVDGLVSLENDVPIMGEAFDPNTGKQVIKPLGVVVLVQPLDQAFVERLSRLTDTQINVFTQHGLSSGSVADYQNADWGGTRAAKNTQVPSINEIKIGDASYYQGLLPLYSNKQIVGTIAVLHSKEIVQKNTWEMIRTLTFIALASLLFIFPIAWYFANSISKPLTLLSRIFRSVASGKQTGMLSDEFSHLENEKQRKDELGDLTQSFIAMDDAINQKIQQINEINSSLEKTIEERTSALITKEQESRTLIENSPDTIARYDKDCRRIYVNPAFGAMAGGGTATLLGKKPSEVPGGKNSELYETRIREVLATGKNTQFELKWPDKDGKEICSHIRLTAEHDWSGAIASVLGVGRDITELNESRTELKRKELAKARFLAAAGHDLRQPLAAANLFIDALRFTKPTTDQNKVIHRLEQAMSTFNEMLDALLNISKLDAGIIKPEYTSINVAELFNWLEQTFAPMTNEKNIRFKLHFPLKEQLDVHSDIGLMKSVLMNLISNAIKFTPQGGILVSARRRGNDVLFQVWNTGIGIKPENLEYIFDEFYQINNPQRDRTKGIGLGLSIAKRAISLLDSDITCRSRSEKGSVFQFHLPLEDAQRNAAQQISTAPSSDNANEEVFVRGNRFVILEDDALVADALSSALESRGGKVKHFHQAETALEDADIEDADYYIVDYMLEGKLNGIQFLNQLRQKRGRPFHAVLMTGDTSPAFIREAENSDWPVLHKPANMSNLIFSLQRSGAHQPLSPTE